MFSPYLLLFLSAFLAATILPAASEAMLVKLQFDGLPGVALWSVATVGNTLGSVVNWVLGAFLMKYSQAKWFYFSEMQLQRGEVWFKRFGVWVLPFAWLPLVGDALTVIAGAMRVPLVLFVLLVALGKGARYLVVMGLMYSSPFLNVGG